MQLIFKLSGRLGNHFYILSAMMYAMKKYNIRCKLKISNHVKNQNIDYVYDNFSEYIIDEVPKNYIDINEQFNCNEYNYDNTIDLDSIINTYINTNHIIYLSRSYFQTNKYFLKYKDEIKQIFINDNENVLKYEQLISEDDVFISVRRGDYITYGFHTLNKNYYIDMYNKYFKCKNIYISSDDINWCKENLLIDKFNNCKNIVYLENLTPLELYNISTYFKNYICSNSTFSSMCELSSEYNQKSVGVKNIIGYICRDHMFSNNCIIYDIKNEQYKKYLDNINDY
jgi:hypothetical protein